jgi:hypothetical protein
VGWTHSSFTSVGSPHCSHSRPPRRFPASTWAFGLALLLSGCGGGGSGSADGSTTPPASAAPPAPAASSAPAPDVNTAQEPPPATPAPEPAAKSTLQASQPGELLAYAKAKLVERQRLRAQARTDTLDLSISGNPTVLSGAVFSAGSVSAPVDRSVTVVQEEGVDEDDVIKSDGTMIYTLSRDRFASANQPPTGVTVSRRRADGGTDTAGRAQLSAEPDATTRYTGMYLAATAPRLAVLGDIQRWLPLNLCDPQAPCFSASVMPYVDKSTVALEMVNVANPSQPVLSDKLRIDGRLVGSRMIGNSLVLVTRFTPRPVADALPWDAPAAERGAAMDRLKASELLPGISVNNGAAQPLMAETECYVEPRNANYGLDVTSITVIDLSSAQLQRSSRCFIGGSEAVYMSRSALYLATMSQAAPPVMPMSGNSRLVFPPQVTTDVHKFALNSGAGGVLASVEYRGSGTVPGHLGWNTQQRSYRLSEHNGDLRVLSFTGQSGWGLLEDANGVSAPPPSPATLTVLREKAGAKALQAVGQLPNAQRPAAIGKAGEQVYAVRFIGDRGYVVTFRRTDPLYVLDLSNPADPKATGELAITGFSDYLFPVGSGLLLGVGKDADDRGAVSGVKVALFDVANPAKPTQVATTTIGERFSYSALEHSNHGIDLFTRGNQTRVVLPVSTYQGEGAGYLFTLQRFEVDAAGRTMKQINPLQPAGKGAWSQYLAQDRTLQIGEKVHYFDGETLSTYDW